MCAGWPHGRRRIWDGFQLYQVATSLLLGHQTTQPQLLRFFPCSYVRKVFHRRGATVRALFSVVGSFLTCRWHTPCPTQDKYPRSRSAQHGWAGTLLLYSSDSTKKKYRRRMIVYRVCQDFNTQWCQR